ncbi:hypothetical protein GCM10008967_33740 [Bacillus carboniphilus]|uniref:Uncharacterized protein n=1 Tax=Bacillus carboniphilus TaxID=86663 RepID=A0ABP3GDW6_9BACI
MAEVRKAKIKMDFNSGFSLSQGLSVEEAVKALVKAIKRGEVEELDVKVEYVDGTGFSYITGVEEDDEDDAEDED